MTQLRLREGRDSFNATQLRLKKSSQFSVSCVHLVDMATRAVAFSLSQSVRETSAKQCVRAIKTTKMNTIESLPSGSLKFSKETGLHTYKNNH